MRIYILIYILMIVLAPLWVPIAIVRAAWDISGGVLRAVGEWL